MRIYIIGSTHDMDTIYSAVEWVKQTFPVPNLEIDHVKPESTKLTEDLIVRCFNKIDDANLIVVATKNGRIGDGTQYEMVYASKMGKPVARYNLISDCKTDKTNIQTDAESPKTSQPTWHTVDGSKSHIVGKTPIVETTNHIVRKRDPELIRKTDELKQSMNIEPYLQQLQYTYCDWEDAENWIECLVSSMLSDLDIEYDIKVKIHTIEKHVFIDMMHRICPLKLVLEYLPFVPELRYFGRRADITIHIWNQPINNIDAASCIRLVRDLHTTLAECPPRRYYPPIF